MCRSGNLWFCNGTIYAQFLKNEDFRHLYMFAHYKIIPTILNELNYNLACRDYNEYGECKNARKTSNA